MKMNDLAGTVATTTVTAKSVLEKPLHLLTEYDISQLTREDCRRYLKEKGMRRPSWNKSQAIQQVISLKSLLEPPPPSNFNSTPALRPHHFSSHTVNSNSSSSMKELLSPADADADADGAISAIGEDGGPNQLAGTVTSCSEPTRDGERRPDSRAVSIRGTDASYLPFDQMTIFYSGGVNVYDRVPVDKQAQAIMHLAVSPIQLSQDERNCGNSTHWSNPCQLPTPSVKVDVSTQDGAAAHSLLQDVEGQCNRKFSLQRYFEKRKDRGKVKMKRKLGSSPSGLEIYLNNQMWLPVNGQYIHNNASCKSHLGLPCSSFDLLDKEQKNQGLSVDLNDKDLSRRIETFGALLKKFGVTNGCLKGMKDAKMLYGAPLITCKRVDKHGSHI